MYLIKNLKDVEFSMIANCMREAFSDYFLKMEADDEQLYTRFYGANVRYDLSFGAFIDDRMIALLLNAVGEYKDGTAAFDAATGVVPEHRGQGIFHQMFDACKTELTKQEISRYCLEVLQVNENAIRLYENIGLKVTRQYTCFKGLPIQEQHDRYQIEIKDWSGFQIDSILHLLTFYPSFENRIEALQRNYANYQIASISNHSEVEAFIVYDRYSGSVKLLGRNSPALSMLREILIYVSKSYANMQIINVDSEDVELVNMLNDIGFHNFCNQYEMSADLKTTE